MDASTDQDLAFLKIAMLRGLMTQEQAREALTQLAEEPEGGRALPELLKAGRVLEPADVAAIRRLVEQGHVPVDIPGYVLVSMLGQGGMGMVYKARQTSLDRMVAIKVLFPQHSKNPEYVARLQQEARAVAKLHHPHIVAAIDFGETAGVHYFVMEFVEGKTLRAILKERGPLPEAEVLGIVTQVAQALAHAHKNRMVHRDVKPENILVSSDGQAKLADLGLAKSSDRGTDLALTSEGMVVGSPHYVSPEQAAGERDLDIRSDIWSLGATLYLAGSGEVPFPGDSPTVVLAKRMVSTCPSPREHAPGLSDGFCHVIERMMAKGPDDRYRDPKELIADLEAIRAGKPPRTRRVEAGRSSVERPRSPSRAGVPARPGSGKSGARVPASSSSTAATIVARAAAPKGATPEAATAGNAGTAGAARVAPAGRSPQAHASPPPRAAHATAGRHGAQGGGAASASSAAGRRVAGRAGPDKTGVWLGGFAAAVVVVGLATFLLRDRGGEGTAKKPVEGAGAAGGGTSSGDEPATTPPTGTGTATSGGKPGATTGVSPRDAEAEKAFAYVRQYAQAHPTEHDDIAERYRKIAAAYPGSAWSFQAEDEARKVEKVRDDARAAKAAALVSRADALCREKKWAEAEPLVDAVLHDYANTPSAAAARELRKRVDAEVALRFSDFEEGSPEPMPWRSGGAKIDFDSDPAHVKEGRRSGRVTYPGRAQEQDLLPCIRSERMPRDWTGYTSFSFWIYSESPTGDELGIRCFVNGETDKFWHNFRVDWGGWKQVRLRLADFQRKGAPSWDRVEGMALPMVEGKPGFYWVDDFRLEK
ncbi:MAG: protein kinase [Planctomycetes bacterium]|nr:protein kinase [Planctomycetota bacterium]